MVVYTLIKELYCQ